MSAEHDALRRLADQWPMGIWSLEFRGIDADHPWEVRREWAGGKPPVVRSRGLTLEDAVERATFAARCDLPVSEVSA